MAEKTEKNKMLGGELYRASDKELLDERRDAQQLLARYNGVPDSGHDMRTTLLRHFLSAVGEGTVDGQCRATTGLADRINRPGTFPGCLSTYPDRRLDSCHAPQPDPVRWAT